jgi:hypothetical protein
MTGTGCGPNGRAVVARQHEESWRQQHPLRPTMRTLTTARHANAMRLIGRRLRVLKATNDRTLRGMADGQAAS